MIPINTIAAIPCAVPGTPGPNPTNPVPIITLNGANVNDPAGRPIMRPDDGHDPAFFIAQGTANASLFTGTIVSLTQFPNFRQGGPWDEQRVGGSFNYAYTNYSTIAIGLFAAAAGIPESIMLGVEDTYAAHMSTFQPHTLYDSTYSHLPEKNVQNTTLGYNLYQSNAFNVCK